MSGQIAESKINEVRERTDVIELISQYVALKRSGANHMGLCPFHAEKSPSFSVHAGRQFFHCFGCGVGGDVFAFLMKIEGLAFPDAVRRLAERAGIDLEERQLSAEELRLQQQRERLFQLNELTAVFYHRQLMEESAGEPGRRYLARRGYQREIAADYRLGYAPQSWELLASHLQQQGGSHEDARTLGLIRPGKRGQGDYDLFRGRLIFPIIDLTGRVIAFGGRVLDQGKPKYINSPESPIYHKGRVLFGHYQARQAMRQSGEAILVEGYFDQLALQRAGFPQAVASCGTALTREQVRLLKRYVERVLLLFDQDAAGRQATYKAMAVLQEEGVPALVVSLPAGEDPDTFLGRQGADAFAERHQQARPAMELFMEDMLASAAAGVEGRARAVESVIERIAALASPLEQELYLKELAEKSEIGLPRLEERLANVARDTSLRQQAVPAEETAGPYPLPPEPDAETGSMASPAKVAAPSVISWSRTERALLGLLLYNPTARETILHEGIEMLFNSASSLQVKRLVELLPEGQEGDEKSIIAKLDPELSRVFKELLAADPEAFRGDQAAMLSDCRAALLREKKKRAREELLTALRQAEQAGDSERAKELMDQFTKLK